MLREISIENVAVIEKASVAFAPGFTVLTGETGAGKSIVIDSINAILGNRTSRDIVRSGAGKAVVWACFDHLQPQQAKAASDAGYDAGDELLLQREVTVDGKSNCRIGGAPATASVLRQVCTDLVQIHGQHDNQSLLDPARHMDVLDAFAQNDALLAAYRERYEALQRIQNEMNALNMNEAEKARKIDLLGYEAEEIERAALQPGEEEELEGRREMIRNAQSIVQGLQAASFALVGDGGDEQPGALPLLGVTLRELQAADAAAGNLSAELTSFAERAGELYYAAQELASDALRNMEQYEYDEQSLNEIETRLDLLYRLKKKYGGSVQEVLEYGARAREELDTITFSGRRLEELEAKKQVVWAQVQIAADALSQSRKEAFTRMEQAVSEALAFLNMPGIVMELRHQKVPFAPAGQDELEFYMSPNPGETPKPMAKIASGGELARIMLAIKSALADRDELATIIYDEIDTGISGLAAGRIGQMLRDTAKGGRQVICVTHTAQVAAYAGQHLHIEKTVRDGRTYTHIRELDEEGRVQELARIISGDKVTETALANAREMLQAARDS